MPYINPWIAGAGLLYLVGATHQAFHGGDWRLSVLYVLYGVANALLATLR